MTEFKVNEIVQVGGEKGKIIEITKPLGTYPIYKVHMMGNGEIRSAARHELVKGMPDEDFQNLFDCFEQARATGTISLLDLLNENTLSNVNASDLGPELFETNVQEDTTVPSPPHPIIVNNVNNHAIKNSRFVQLPISPTEFILEKENKRTKAKTTSHIKLITQFLLSKEETRPIEIIPPADLNTYLMEFLLCVRQTNGSEYEPSTLRNMISSFDR